jgi:3-oxoacyl-(acyl-carrier-protein) synthase
MSKTFINGASCISVQPSFTEEFPSYSIENKENNILYAIEPAYKEYIPPASIRRMAKGVKMGIVAGIHALKQAQISSPEAILVGTGMGCVQDSEKFLRGILDNQEQHLTPTAFIQSTHNTVAGQIALNMQCKGMNFTYVNGAVSFESALLEAKMQMEQNLLKNVLVGGVDEHSPHTLYLYELANIIKDKGSLPQSILSPKTQGVRFGEGATFFALSNYCNESTFAELIEVSFLNRMDINEIPTFINHFLHQQGITINDISMVISGRNDNKDDIPYFKAFENLFSSIPILIYKHLTGEFLTASAIGLWIACNALKKGTVPQSLNILTQKEVNAPIQYILLYNQYLGKEHSLILLRKK